MDKDNKHADDKLPIDELFARKLGNASLPPGADGFERLQARLGQRQAKPQLILWRNPNVQRYVAVAACLLLVCLFGWLYLSDGHENDVNSQQVATRQPEAPASTDSETGELGLSDNATSERNGQTRSGSVDHSAVGGQKSTQLAAVEEKGGRSADKRSQVETQSDKPANRGLQTPMEQVGESMIAHTEPVDSKTDNAMALKAAATETPAAPERMVTAQPTPAPAAERVLVVMIDEPEQLAAVRQAARAVVDEPIVAANEKTRKETRANGFWEQVRRVKQGEVFARRDTGGDERGLISRAYNGLKHSIDKDKSTKQ